MKKIKLPSEITYIVAIVLLALAVAILTSADFGISMIVAPAYLLSLKTGFLTFGQAEYVLQAGLFVILCIVLRNFRWTYLTAFLTCLIYGAVLDLWRLIPCFNPTITQPESIDLRMRIAMFIIGVLLTSFSVALFFKTYLYPQVNDFFVKAVTERYNLKLAVFKTIVDLTYLTVSVIMSFAFFQKTVGISWGTIVMAVINGTIIGSFSKLIDKIFDIQPLFRKFSTFFTIEKLSGITVKKLEREVAQTSDEIVTDTEDKL